MIRLDKGIGKIVQRTNVQNEGIIRLDKGIGKVVRWTNVQNGLNTLSTIKKKVPWNQMKKRGKKEEGMKYEDTHNIITILQWRGRTKRYSQRMDES